MNLRDKKGKFLKGFQHNPKAQFKKGFTPWNKGLKMRPETFDKLKRTMFSKGHIPDTTKHFGKPYLNVGKNKYGNDEKTWFVHINGKRKYYLKYLCQINNIELNGKIPRLKDGFDINTEPTINDIILISRSENMRLNSVQRFPEDIRKMIQLKGVLNRQINLRK